MSQTVVEIPGLPPGVEVRRSTRRRRSVTAYREGGRTIVVVPQRMARADIPAYVAELVGRLEARESRGRRSDAELVERAAVLSRRYLEGRAVPASVRWVGNQRRRWGSCTPVDRSIRLSDRLQGMPGYVVDYVLLHELVHLLVTAHDSAFEAWMQRYPRLLEARAFLAGVDHALGQGLDQPDDEPAGDEPPADDELGTDGTDSTEGSAVPAPATAGRPPVDLREASASGAAQPSAPSRRAALPRPPRDQGTLELF